MVQLTHAQKMNMYENGFIHVPGVIPPAMVKSALTAINHSLGEGIDPTQITKFRAQSYCPELQGDPVIKDLFNKTPVIDLCASLIGEDNLLPIGGGQIALRFPTLQDPPAPIRGHLDGMYTPTNGVKEGTIGNFTMLVGVLLSDVTESYAGNLTVWPGTHRQFESYFQEHGPESLLNGMPPVEMPAPQQTLGKAGDVILCHYQLAHGVAQNLSPHVRYAIYFRLSHRNHRDDWRAPMTNLWLHWPGMSDVIPQE